MAEITEVREKALRDTRRIDHWNGERKDGEWVRESICCDPVKRTFEHHTRGYDEDGNEIVVRGQVTEIVYQHDGYRPKFDGEKKTRKAFFWRGARVWRD